jgi:uncharacterized repeat protein (TIGR02543 family)
MKNLKILPLILVIVFIFAFFQSPAKLQASGIPVVLAQESFGTVVQAQPVAQIAPARQIAMTEPQQESQTAHTKELQLAAEKTKAEPMAGNIKKMKPGRDYAADEVLVKANTEEEAEKAAAAYGAQLKSYSEFGFAVLTLPEGKTVRAAIEQGASKDNALPVAYPNNYYKVSETAVAYTPDDPEIDDQYYHREMGDGLAWDITKGTSDVVVAVIDTGIDTDHPEFTGRISSLSYNSRTRVQGVSAVQADYDHGCHVAGIIAAAQDNAAGGSGIAPGVTIMVIKANMASPYTSSFSSGDLLEGIYYAADHGADIINMSLGRNYEYGEDALEQAAIQYAQNKGVLVVCAAGNERDDHAGYPAAYAECVAVSALKGGQVFDDTYSNYGPEVDISAAGTNIYSTVPNDTYSEKSGTSMATPMVCGVAALIKSQNPDMTPAQLKQKLYDTAIDKGQPGRDDEYGCGAVSTINALSTGLFTVTFDTGEGSAVPSVLAAGGSGITQPIPPGRSGYSFLGWSKLPDYDFSNRWNFISSSGTYDAVTSDITLYAGWMEGEYNYTEKDGEITITGYGGPAGDVVIPESIGGKPVTAIGNNAFRSKIITGVTIPDSVTGIEPFAFYQCSMLQAVNIGASVKTIGRMAFMGCIRLTGVIIPDKVSDIGENAFCACDSLQSASLGSGLKTIGEYAFAASGLTGIMIPNNVTTMGSGVFEGCGSLSSASLPAGLKAIPDLLFHSNPLLAAITIPEGVESIGNGAFEGCTAIKQITIPDSVTSIGGMAFSFGWDQTPMGLQSITIGSGVKSIGNWAFQKCTSLSSIKIGGKVEDIGEYAFSFCTALTSIKFPQSLANLGIKAFQACGNLNSVYFYGNAPTAGTELFFNCPVGTSVYYISGNTGFTNPWNGKTAQTFVPSDSLSVKFNLMGASGQAPAAQSCAYLGKAACPPDPSYPGHSFAGWFDNPAYSGTAWDFENDAVTWDTTLYAKWENITRTVTFIAGEGMVNPQTLQVTYGSAYGELPKPTRAHYNFEGWYTGENGAGDKITANSIVETDADHYLYANWNQTFTVTLDAGEGTVSPETLQVTLGSPYGTLPKPEREHYGFGGWYTGENGTGDPITEDTVCDKDYDHTLYAKWLTDACSVEFDSMEGSAVQTQTVAYGEKAVKPQDPSRDGFVFAGWYKEDGYIHEWNFQTETVTADIMLFAKWNVRVTITFEKSDVSQGGRADGCITLMASGGAAGQYEYSIHNGASWQEGNVFNGLKEGTYYGVARDKSDVTNVSAAAKIVIAAIKPAFVQVKVSCKKTNATLLGAANGKIILTASGGSSGKYLYSINGGRTWQTSPSFNVAAGSYSAAVCDPNDRANSVRVSVTIHEPRFAGRFLASKMPSKAVCGTGIIIAAPTSPRGYTLKFISYVSGNTKTAYVDKKGNVTFLAGGSVKLTVTSVFKAAGKKDKTIKYTKTIAVTQLISSIAMSKTATVYVNKKITLAAKISPATATNKKLKWTSGNTRIATVSSSGVVTGKAKGTVVIKCTAQDGSKVYASCTVTVK